ncbi:DUF2971 domain-containing protein [Clostridium beijerinckii]|uniref:DUF2971 domain-containing protein n=1 Tax=Clostridium beijerinckii TaxID=1520 RepID=UPI000310C3EA|nr:DUF2971 domain-containing protein [Clostridium beijerinckii]
MDKEIPEFIYKYMTFEQFVDLVENEQLYLTNIPLWEDVYEGHAIKEFFEYINKKEDLKNKPGIKADIDFAVKCKYAQSWILDDIGESDAMWRIYSPQKTGVRIKVKAKDIYDSIKDILNEDIEYEEKDGTKISKEKFLFFEPKFEKIIYGEHIDFSKYKYDYRHVVGDTMLAYRFYDIPFEFYKRNAFAHENEFRFSVELNPVNIFHNDTREIEEIVKDKNYFKPVLYYSVENSKIQEVLLDPRAPEYFEKTFNMYCEKREFNKNKIKFEKSKLYTLE